MAEAKTEQEPSIEEILESIRQIISEDTEEDAAPAETVLEAVKEDAVPPSGLSLAPEAEAPVPPSDLTLKGAEETPVPPSDLTLKGETEAAIPPSDLSLVPAPEATGKAAPLSLTPDIAEPVDKPAPLDLTEQAAPESSSQSAIEMMDIQMAEKDKSPEHEDSADTVQKETLAADALMSAETANAVTDSLAKLLTSNVPIENEGHENKVTLEEMARSLMKPLIKTWLDQNLPGIIEKAVQKEVEKLSRRAMDR